MKVNVTFNVDWPDYEDVCAELIVEDMFEHCPMKDGVTIENVTVERTFNDSIMFETLGAHLRNMYGSYANIVQILDDIHKDSNDEKTKEMLKNFLLNKIEPEKLQDNLQHLIDLSNLPEVESINWRATELFKKYKEE